MKIKWCTGKLRILFIFSGLLFHSLTGLIAQSSDSLITQLQSIDQTIRQQNCPNPKIMSNRAMNLFLADKIGSYLTDYKSLSFYKNNITLNLRDGLFSLNHNLFQPSGADESVRTFYVVGIRAKVADGMMTAITSQMGSNQLGATLKKTWIAGPKTHLTDCFEKTLLDAKRETGLALLVQEIKRREADFIRSLTSISNEKLLDPAFAQTKLDFYKALTDEFLRRFTEQQYQDLVSTNRYKTIATHWTSLSIYLPVILQRFTVADSLVFPVQTKKAYPFELTLSHTRFWESKQAGRFFLSLEATLFQNNSVRGFLLTDMSYDQYKSAGGIDTLGLRQRNINSLSIGAYQTFLTPAVRLNLVYYPPESHIGISATIEQTIGTYRALNGLLGIPIVLIDKTGSPAANFEVQVRYMDCTHAIFPYRSLSDNLSVNLTVGVPFSKIIY